MSLPADFDSERLADHALEGRDLSRRGPQLELGVSRRSQLQERVLSAIVKFDPGDRLRVAAIEVLGKTQHRRERADRSPPFSFEVAEFLVPPIGNDPTMIARDQRDDFDLIGVKPAKVAIADKVVRVLVMPDIADVDADVVQHRGVLEPLAFPVGEAVRTARVVEEGCRDLRDLLRVLRPVVAPLTQLDHAPTPDVGITIGLRDFLSVARDVVEDQTLSE